MFDLDFGRVAILACFDIDFQEAWALPCAQVCHTMQHTVQRTVRHCAPCNICHNNKIVRSRISRASMIAYYATCHGRHTTQYGTPCALDLWLAVWPCLHGFGMGFSEVLQQSGLLARPGGTPPPVLGFGSVGSDKDG